MNWYDSKIHRGIARFAKNAGWVLNSHMTRTGRLPLGWTGDGVLALIDNDETLQFVKSLQVPVVDIGSRYSEFTQVWGDHFQSGRLAAEHFLERNHRNFLFLAVQNGRLEQEVSSGFTTALEAAGHACEVRRMHPDDGSTLSLHYSETVAWMATQLRDAPRPLAVLTQNDDTSALALEAADSIGAQVPEEIAVIGTGNSELVCEFQPVTLSSIGSNHEGLGQRTAIELDRLLQGQPARKTVIRVPPGRVHTRQSTDFLAVSNPHVKTVLREIWSHFDRPLNIGHLTGLVPVSRSGLYNLFNREVGRSMARELMLIRIRKAKELLANTDYRVSEIGRRVGFTNLVSFSRAFSNVAGISPAYYRRGIREAMEVSGPAEEPATGIDPHE